MAFSYGRCTACGTTRDRGKVCCIRTNPYPRDDSDDDMPLLLEPDTVLHNKGTFHIQEEPGKIDWHTDVLMPSDEYYNALRADMAKHHPAASTHVLDHLLSLETFLDRSILSGFSYGLEKAFILVMQGKLLGNFVGRNRSEPDGERVQAINELHL